MPAPCPGDPDYPEGLPLTRENFEREIERIRDQRAPMRAELDRAESAPPDAWDRALRDEIDDDERDSDGG